MGDLLHVEAAFEDALRGELARAVPSARVRDVAPGLIACDWGDEAVPSALAFCRQCLPDAVTLEASSVKAWAQCVFEHLEGVFGADEAPPWRLHAFALPGSDVSGGRVALIEAALDDLLKRRRRAWRRVQGPAQGPWRAGEVLVQLVLWTGQVGAVSVADAALCAQRVRLIEPFVGGAVALAQDKRPPSRAYQKLLEVEVRLARPIAPGERCVDLGASPGGWSFVALERGAHLVAVDRSPLRADLMAHPGLRFERGDAFKYAPREAPLDWLLCDVIAAPARSLELIDTWLSRRWCRNLVVTLKLKSRDEDVHLDAARALLERHGGRCPSASWWLRHLDANQNEVTVYGTGWAA